MASRSKAGASKKRETARPFAILFELENLAASGRSVAFDVLKGALASRNVDVTTVCFARFCLDSPPSVFLPHLLAHAKKERLSETKLLAEIKRGINLSFLDGNVRLDKDLGKMLREASGRGFLVGCLSALEAETAGALLARLGLADVVVKSMACADDKKRFPSPDEWLRLAKSVGVSPTRCLALATSALATRTALSAGMKVAALPDKFTAFEDFSGADFLFNGPGEVPVMKIAALFGR